MQRTTARVQADGDPFPVRGARGAWALVAVFSAAVNILMLAGPLFMLQLYDRILPSRSGASLAALFALVCGLYTAMAILDVIRLRLASDIGARVQARLEAAIAARPGMSRAVCSPALSQDMDLLRRATGATGIVGLFDLLWAPLFLGALFVLHPWLGLAGLAGCVVLGMAALLHHASVFRATQQASDCATAAAHLWDVAARHSGGRPPPPGWREARTRLGRILLRLGRGAAAYTGFSRSFRLFLQSLLLALGAWLVMLDQTTAGAMVAATILVSRALVPVEQVASAWPLLRAAWAARKRLRAAFDARAPGATPTQIPAAGAALVVRDAALVLPGLSRPGIQGVSFALQPGTALGVIGPEGAGKSLLLQLLVGAAPLTSGAILWGAGPVLHLSSGKIGYLPHQIDLIAGSVAQNVTLGRFAAPAAIVRALRRAGLDEVIATLPDGLDTAIGPGGRPLSRGETVRLGLARALLGQPRLLLLDDPHAGLDHAGCAVLDAALRAALADGAIVVLTAQRPSAIGLCHQLLLLEAGRVTAFGPREAVLRAHLSSQSSWRTEGAGAALPGHVG